MMNNHKLFLIVDLKHNNEKFENQIASHGEFYFIYGLETVNR